MATHKGQGHLDGRMPTGQPLASRSGKPSGPVRRFSRTSRRSDSRDHLQRALDAAGVAAWDVDLTSRTVLWSTGLETVLGLDDVGFDGTYRRYLKSVIKEDRRSLRRAVDSALKHEGKLRHQHRVAHRDGSLHYLFIQAVVSVDAEGRPNRAAGTVTDVSDRERAASRLRLQLAQAQKMEAVGQLAGGIAHDFNNALTTILGNVQVALGSLAPGDPAANAITGPLQEIERTACHASKLAARLLAFGRRRGA